MNFKRGFIKYFRDVEIVQKTPGKMLNADVLLRCLDKSNCWRMQK